MPEYQSDPQEWSLAQKVAALPEEERLEVLSGLDPDQLLWDWSFWGRPKQFAPKGDWNIWLLMAGRGFGKTRTAAEWVREEAKSRMPDGSIKRFALVARIAKDLRDVMILGGSGIDSITPPSEKPKYEPSKSMLTWPNGNTATLYTADEPNQLRGPAFTHSWGDEIAAWRRLPDDSGLTAWDNLRFATRDGDNPKIIATTTPKRVPIMFDLIKEAEEHPDKVKITKGSTLDNAGVLGSAYIQGITGKYGGTKTELQELYGEMLDDAEGLLWDLKDITDHEVTDFPSYVPLRIIGVDPSVAENPRDECGIVAVGSTAEHQLYKRQAYVLEDASIKASPEVWTKQVVKMAQKWQCPVVAEVNQGGALVANAIHQIDPDIKVFTVHSKVGKKLRAEPVVLAYEQGRVHHVLRNDLDSLVSQMSTWVPDSGPSPDRIDALVHALTALLIEPPAGFAGGRVRAKSQASARLPAQTIGGRVNQITPPSNRLRPTNRRGGFSVR